MVLWTHVSRSPKWHLDHFTHCCTAHCVPNTQTHRPTVCRWYGLKIRTNEAWLRIETTVYVTCACCRIKCVAVTYHITCSRSHASVFKVKPSVIITYSIDCALVLRRVFVISWSLDHQTLFMYAMFCSLQHAGYVLVCVNCWLVVLSVSAAAKGGPRAIILPSLSLHFPTFYSIFSIFYFSLFPFLLASSIFLLFHLFPFYQNLTPLHFQAGCRRRQLNLALVLLCWFYVICSF